jgi:hypothetical protein
MFLQDRYEVNINETYGKTEGTPNGKGGKRYTGWELLEWSIVPVPANPQAVRVLSENGKTALQFIQDFKARGSPSPPPE